MLKRSMLILSFLLALCGMHLFADAYWYVGPDMGAYDDFNNWNGGVVPGADDLAGVNNGSGIGPLIDFGVSVECLDFNLGQSSSGTDSRLYIDGGTLTVNRTLYTGRLDSAAKGTIILNDPNSLLDASGGQSFVIGRQGTGILDITGGTVKAKWTRVGLDSANVDQGGSGSIYLNDANSLFQTSLLFMNDEGPDRALIDISGGTLVLDAYNYGPEVEDWAANGQITAYGGDPLASLNIEWMDYDGNGDGETVVTAYRPEVADCYGSGTAWYVGPDQGLWIDGSNWNLGGFMPCEQTNAGVNTAGTGPKVTTGMDVSCLDFNLGQFDDGSDSRLYLEGGTLTVNRNFYAARLGSLAQGTVYVSGENTLLDQAENNSFVIGRTGTGTVIMDGGRVNAYWVRLGLDAANTDQGGNGTIIINDGVFYCFHIFMNSDPAKAYIDLSNGTLVIDGYYYGPEIESWIADGRFTAFGVNPNNDPLVDITISWMDYDGNDGGDMETVVTATKIDCLSDWSLADIEGDCDVDLDDLALMTSEWTDYGVYQTLYDVDFGSEPNILASGLFVDRDPGTSEYNFTDTPGMLHFTQPTIFDATDAYYYIDNAHVEFSAKADDTTGIALWHEFLITAEQRFVSWIRVMKDSSDPTKQVVEFLKGSVDWGVFGTQGAQDAVYVYGFSADDVLTMTGDYTVDKKANTVTLDWQVTDGVTTQSGTNVSFSPLAGGAGTPWALTLWGPGTGYYDHLTYELLFAPEYDLDGDDDVDFQDFAEFAKDWYTLP